jgi:hypothetical protein
LYSIVLFILIFYIIKSDANVCIQFMLHKLFINSEFIMSNITKGISLAIATLFYRKHIQK